SGFWRGADGRERGAYYVEWRRGQMARTAPFLHNPTICLPYSGSELVEELGGFDVRWSGGAIPFRAYVFRYMNREMTVAFAVWDTARGRALTQEAEGEWWRSQWRDVREARRHQPAQLLSFTVAEREDLDRMAEEIAAMIRAE
nr:hypothetical protein [Opitutaceae bacterium]